MTSWEQGSQSQTENTISGSILVNRSCFIWKLSAGMGISIGDGIGENRSITGYLQDYRKEKIKTKANTKKSNWKWIQVLGMVMLIP